MEKTHVCRQSGGKYQKGKLKIMADSKDNDKPVQKPEMAKPANQENAENSRRVLSLAIKDVSVLYTAYMPFIDNGGLFIPMKKQLNIGEEVFILLQLIDDPEKIPVTAKVVWVTPNYSQGNRAPGVGVQFLDKDNPARTRIESLLAEKLASGEATHTM